MIRHRRPTSTRAFLIAATICLAAWALPPGVLAQVERDDRVAQNLAQLKSSIERSYRVAVIRDGIVLVPRTDGASVRSIELTDDQVLLDGAPVTGAELRARLPNDAAAISRLSLLDGQSRRALFAPAPPAPPAPPAAPPASPSTVEPPEPPAAADRPARPQDWVERDRYARGGARVRIGGDVWVKSDEWIGDAVVAVLGSVRVDGRVDGDVVSVGGGVQLGPQAIVRGEVVSVGGAVERAPGARVGGQINEVRIGMPSFSPHLRFWPRGDWSWFGSSLGATTDLLATLARMGILALLVVALATVFPAPVTRVSNRVSAEPWRAGLVGLAAQLLFVPVLIITVLVLAISIVGIPLLLLVPFAVVAFLFAFLLGFAGTASATGQLIARRFGGHPLKLVVAALVGLAVIWALTAIARFAGLTGLPVRIVLSVVLVAGVIVEYVAWTVGLGGVLVSRFGRRDIEVPNPPPSVTPPPVEPSADVL